MKKSKLFKKIPLQINNFIFISSDINLFAISAGFCKLFLFWISVVGVVVSVKNDVQRNIEDNFTEIPFAALMNVH